MSKELLNRNSEVSQQCSKVVEAIEEMLEVFFKSEYDSINKIMGNGMLPIAKLLGIDGLGFTKYVGTNGVDEFKQLYQLDVINNGCSFPDTFVVPDDKVILNWIEQLKQDEIVEKRLSEASYGETVLMHLHNIKSLLIVPIFIDESFWGSVICEYRDKEHHFSAEYVRLIKLVSRLCVKSVIKVEKLYEVNARNNLNRAIFNNVPIGMTIFDEQLNFLDCNEAILNICGNSKLEYLNNFFASSPEYQPDGMKSKDKAYENMQNVLNGENKKMEWVHCLPSGETNLCEITMTRVKNGDKQVGLIFTYDLSRIKKLEIALAEVNNQVNLDALTGINNRRYFDATLAQIMGLLSRSEANLSLLMVDIDYFKRFNDTYGHQKGDICLKVVAETLSKTISRAEDFVARYGGEEFMVVLPNTDEKGACIMAEAILRNVRECNIPHEKNDVADCVTISIGVASGKVSHKHTAEDYTRIADQMLYESKKNGRNRYTLGTFEKSIDKPKQKINEKRFD